MMGGGFVGMVLILVGTFALALWLVRALFPDGNVAGDSRRQPEETAMAIARRHYAAGEISKEEFEAIKRECLSQNTFGKD